MKKLKLITVVGTRPEIIRLCEIIRRCDQFFDHILVHTGQNWDYTLNEVFFQELQIRKPDYFLNVVGDDLGQTMGNIIASSYDLFVKEKPDALLLLGDTNSALSAISAKRLKIPIFHMEAGNRCFDQNVPEEINRKIVDHISDINMPYTEHSRRYLLSEGFRKEHVYVTGSPMPEVFEAHKSGIENSTALEKLGLQKNGYFVVSAHREENIDIPKNFDSLMNALNVVAETYQKPLIFSTHPRSMKRIESTGVKLHPLIRNLPPFGFFDYCKLQKNAACVLSDSGTLSEESAMLGFPAVLIRTSTERPEVLDKGTIVIGGITANEMLQSIELATGMFNEGLCGTQVPDYQDTNVSDKVIKIIGSYVKIINMRVWNK